MLLESFTMALACICVLFNLHIASGELIFDYMKFDPAHMGHLGEEFH